MIELISVAVLAIASNTNSDCPMRPPPLDVAHIESSKGVKSVVVDPSKVAATVLMKDGGVLRVTNMGCQHSGSIVQLWITGSQPAMDQVSAWVNKVQLAAGIGFDPGEGKYFEAWLAGVKLKPNESGGLSVSGEGAGDVEYEVSINPYGGVNGTFVTISYAYR